MNVSGITPTPPTAYWAPVARPTTEPASDQVSMSLSADTFSGLVSDAGQMPEVRGEVVDAFKSRIQAGEYPTSDTLNGLVDKMGSTWMKAATVLFNGPSGDS